MERKRRIVEPTLSFGASHVLHVVSPDERIASGKALRDKSRASSTGDATVSRDDQTRSTFCTSRTSAE
jgi:hypothetical protein